MKNFFKKFHYEMTLKRNWVINSLISVPFAVLDLFLMEDTAVANYTLSMWILSFFLNLIFRTVFVTLLCASVFAGFNLRERLDNE